MKYTVDKMGYKNNVVIQQMSLELKKGEVLGLIAPNGKGKSTIFKGIMNRLHTNESTLEIDDNVFKYPITSKEEASLYRLVSIMPDQNTLVGHVSGLEHLKLVKDEWQSSIEINHVIELLSMQHYIKKKVSDYSFGMKQRLCFAMQIIMDTDMMLMDEVMNALDIMNVERISIILNELKEKGKMIIIASHLLENLMSYSDKALFILKHNEFKLVDLHEEMPNYIKVTLKNPNDHELIHQLKAHNFNEEFNNQFVKEQKNISFDELMMLFKDQRLYSINLSRKTLTEIYYELYMKE